VFYYLNAAAFHGYWYTTFQARPKLLQSRSRPMRERAKKVAADNMAAAAQVRVAVVAHDCILTRRAQALPLNAVIVERRDAPVLLDCSNDRELAIGRVQLIKTACRSSSVSLFNHHPLPSVLADLPWSASFKTLPSRGR
jgi:hypothetical protein